MSCVNSHGNDLVFVFESFIADIVPYFCYFIVKDKKSVPTT